jgi:hypothetical protein
MVYTAATTAVVVGVARANVQNTNQHARRHSVGLHNHSTVRRLSSINIGNGRNVDTGPAGEDFHIFIHYLIFKNL